jgi:prophage antirepressor-like protein
MKNLQIVRSQNFGEVKCDFYRSENDEILMTINQLAQALEYASKSGIENIIIRNEYLRGKEFSTTHRLRVVEGNREVEREMRVFTEDGIYEVTMLSGTKKAQEFRAWVRQVLKELRKTGHYSIKDKKQQELIKEIIEIQSSIEKFEFYYADAEVQTARARKQYRDWLDAKNKYKSGIKACRSLLAYRTKELELLQLNESGCRHDT